MPRLTKIQKEKNIQKVIDWIISGESDQKLLQKTKKEFDIGIRQARNYKKWAQERIVKDNDEELEIKRYKRILQVEKKLKLLLDSKKVDPKEINAFKNLQDLLMKLEGTERSKKIKLQGDKENPLLVQQITGMVVKDEPNQDD